jgi:excinuclease ABC subunit A
VDTLGRALAPTTHTTSISREPLKPGEHYSISGAPKRTIVVDQARPQKGNVLGVFGLEAVFQNLYSVSEDARMHGLSRRDFARRCTACHGRGNIRTDMGFLPDSVSTCETCGGSGFPDEIRAVKLRGISMDGLFALTVDEAYRLWKDEKRVAERLDWCRRAGLGYLVLRQTRLSGGEAQRLTLAYELGRSRREDTMFLIDEPTVGLHPDDTEALVSLLRDLVAAGQSVVVVEHNPQFLASCDWLVELGPGAAEKGGRVVAEGPPARFMRGKTPTAPYIREVFA